MSYTARPSFTGGAGQNQQQQRGQPNNASNNQTGGIPNMAMMNNAAAAAAAMQSNSMSSTSATSVQPTIDYQKLFQQHFQTQLLGQQLQKNQQAAITQFVNNMQKNGVNLQPQYMNQLVELHALNILQKQIQQTLPTNTTMPPVPRNPQKTNTTPRTNTHSHQANRNTAGTGYNASPVPRNVPNQRPPTYSPVAAPTPYSDSSASHMQSTATANLSPSLTITRTNAMSANPSMNSTPLTSLPRDVHISPSSRTIAPSTSTHMAQPSVSLSAVQKMLPSMGTLPRTKQTPRKSTNPIRTTAPNSVSLTSSVDISLVPSVPNSMTNVKPAQPMNSLLTANVNKPKPVELTTLLAASNPSDKMKHVKVDIRKEPTLATAAAANNTTVSMPANNSVGTLAKNQPEAKPKQSMPSNAIAPMATTTPTVATSTAPSTAAPKPMPREIQPAKPLSVSSVTSKPVATVQPLSSTKAITPPTIAAAAPAKTTQNETKAMPATNTPSASKETAPQKTTEDIKSKQNPTAPKVQTTVTPALAAAATAAKAAQETAKPPLPPKAVPAKIETNVAPSTPVLSAIESKAKRNRLKTIPYQSPTPEIELVSKISAHEAYNKNRNFKKNVDEDKLTLFYKNEFLAVRNADGGFYLCQAMHNVYKSSPKIRIRWLSEEPSNPNIYCMDFCDSTDLDCVLTTVTLDKSVKSKYELTKEEKSRIESILKKAIDVEKGIVARPEVTEENPDGLDLSLYKDESQIEKKLKRKSSDGGSTSKKSGPSTSKKRKTKESDDDDSEDEDESDDDSVDEPRMKAKISAKSSAKRKSTAKTTSPKKASKRKADDKDGAGSTPAAKRTATKRKLVDEESSETEAKASISVDKSAEETVDKTGNISNESSPTSDTQSGRPIRRSRI